MKIFLKVITKIVRQNPAFGIIGFSLLSFFLLLAGCTSKYPASLAFITNERDGLWESE